MLSSYFLKGVCLLIPHETLRLFRELLHLTILKYKPVILLIIIFQVVEVVIATTTTFLVGILTSAKLVCIFLQNDCR